MTDLDSINLSLASDSGLEYPDFPPTVSSMAVHKFLDSLSLRALQNPLQCTLFNKTAHAVIMADKQNDLFDKIVSGCKQTFSLPTYDGKDKLDKLCSLLNAIQSARQHYGKYEMSHMFNIVKYDDNSKITITDACNLCTQYVSVSAEDVAQSNCWYHTMPLGIQAYTQFDQDMKVMQEHLEQSIESTLLSNCVRPISNGIKKAEVVFVIQDHCQRLLNTS